MMRTFYRYSGAAFFFLLSVWLLGIGFYNNQWKAAKPGHFAHFQRDSESLIIGRLAKSRQDGIFSSGGLPGRANTDRVKDAINYQYRLYLENLTIHHYSPYKSQIGFQGILLSFLDHITHYPNETTLRLFYC